MHALSSYRGNRPTHKQTGPITIHCAAASAHCDHQMSRQRDLTQLYGWAKTVHYNELPCYYLFSWLSRDYREATTVGVRIRISIPSPLHK